MARWQKEVQIIASRHDINFRQARKVRELVNARNFTEDAAVAAVVGKVVAESSRENRQDSQSGVVGLIQAAEALVTAAGGDLLRAKLALDTLEKLRPKSSGTSEKDEASTGTLRSRPLVSEAVNVK